MLLKLEISYATLSWYALAIKVIIAERAQLEFGSKVVADVPAAILFANAQFTAS